MPVLTCREVSKRYGSTGALDGEVVVLAGFGPQSAHLPEQPLQRHVTPAQVLRDVLPCLVAQVQQDSTRLEDRDRLADLGRRVVNDRRDAIVRRDAQKFRLKLRALANVPRHNPIRQPSLPRPSSSLETSCWMARCQPMVLTGVA